jgi:hypothetical protein
LAIFFLGIWGILYASLKHSHTQNHESLISAENFFMPQDVRYRNDVGTPDRPIGYPHKLLIVVKNDGDKDLVVRPGKWQGSAADISFRRMEEHLWTPEGPGGWQNENWGKETREPLLISAGQAVQTWVGLYAPLDDIELRRRLASKRLGTLIVPFIVDGNARSETMKL